MILAIQTNIAGELHAWIIDHGVMVVHRSQKVAWHGSEKLLPMVDGMLKHRRLQVKKIQRIVVVRGPGPFSAVRTGIIVANSLGWLLKIPVLGVTRSKLLTDREILRLIRQRAGKKFSAVRLSYGKAPNITRPKA